MPGPHGPGGGPGGPGGPGGFRGGPGGPGFGGPGFGPGPRPFWGPGPFFWNPFGPLISGTQVCLAAAGGWLLGRSMAGSSAAPASTTTVVYNYPAPTGNSQSSSTMNLEASVTLISLMGPPPTGNTSNALFVDEDILIVVQIGENSQQVSVLGKSSAQAGLGVNQTLYIALKGNTQQVQVAIYKQSDTSLLAVGHADTPKPVSAGQTSDVSIHLNTLQGQVCGRILTTISYNSPIPRPQQS